MIKVEKFIDTSTLFLARRWLEYVPASWNLDDIKKKQVSDLTEEEHEILLQVKRDEILLEYVRDIMMLGGELVYVSPDDAAKIDAIWHYVESRAYELKIDAGAKDYVAMILKEVDFSSEESIQRVNSAIENIEDEMVREYAKKQLRVSLASYKAKSTTRNAGKKSRKKKPHSVFSRVPNRIK